MSVAASSGLVKVVEALCIGRCDGPRRHATVGSAGIAGASMARKIAIVGAGAVGGYAGAHMVRAGEDVTFIDPWPAHIEHMRQHGLRVTHARDVPPQPASPSRNYVDVLLK